MKVQNRASPQHLALSGEREVEKVQDGCDPRDSHPEKHSQRTIQVKICLICR